MQKCLRIFLLIVSVFFAAVLSSNAGRPRWKENNRKVDSVITMKDSERPTGSMQVMRLDEVLSIGKKGDDHIFESIRNVDVDGEGNIYVLDNRECKIYVFDKTGKIILEFGKKGQGPGEFQLPIIMRLLNDKEIVVNDLANARIEYFSLKGDLLREVSRARYFRMARIDLNSKGNIIGLDSARTSGIDNYEIVFFAPDLTPIWKLTALRMTTTSPNSVSPLQPIVFFHVLKGDDIVWASSDKYELNIVNSSGLTVKKIKKDYKPIKITEEMRKGIIDDLREGREFPPDLKFEFPENYPPLQHINIDDENRIYVHTYEKNPEGKDMIDIFGKDGKYLAKVALDYFPWVIKNGKFYAVAEDAGFPILKIFNIKWGF